MSIESLMPSNHLILCHRLSLPALHVSQNQGLFWVNSSHQVAKVLELFSSGGQSIGLFWVNSSHWVAKVLELQLQHQYFQWIFRVDFLLELTGLISLQSKGLSRVFSNITVQKHQFFGAQPSLWFNSLKYMQFLFINYALKKAEKRIITCKWVFE